MMLEIDRELVAQHNIYHRHQLTINRDGHISHAQWPLWIMQLSFWHRIAKDTVGILLILIRRHIPTLHPTL